MSTQLLNSIHPDARIGKQVEIGPFTTIYGDVEIGDETWIGPSVTIMDGARIERTAGFSRYQSYQDSAVGVG
jgi:UDP-N-acetylglucosamine acyltransferase